MRTLSPWKLQKLNRMQIDGEGVLFFGVSRRIELYDSRFGSMMDSSEEQAFGHYVTISSTAKTKVK